MKIKKWQVLILENGQISGESAFEQFTTFGIPPEILTQITGYPIEMKTFEKLMFEHRRKSSIAGIKRFGRQREIFKGRKINNN